MVLRPADDMFPPPHQRSYLGGWLQHSTVSSGDELIRRSLKLNIFRPQEGNSKWNSGLKCYKTANKSKQKLTFEPLPDIKWHEIVYFVPHLVGISTNEKFTANIIKVLTKYLVTPVYVLILDTIFFKNAKQ